MPGLPSLEIVVAEVAAEMAAQERRRDALDAKAGGVLGFSGVLVGLAINGLRGPLGMAALAFAAAAALFAVAGFAPRRTPVLTLTHLRDNYLVARPEFTWLHLVDARLDMQEQVHRRLELKACLVTMAMIALGGAVLLAVLAVIL